MIRVPIEPYYINAANWWLENRNTNNEEFRAWLGDQGAVMIKREKLYPWLDFETEYEAEIFKLKWADASTTTP